MGTIVAIAGASPSDLGSYYNTEAGIVGQDGHRGLSADALQSALGLSGSGRGEKSSPSGPTGVLFPGPELAVRLDRYVDALIRIRARQHGPSADKCYVDLMVGLSDAAEALRASDRCDHEMAERRLRSAVALLQGADLTELAFLDQ